MFNLVTTTLIFLLLISQDILLLNEEILILISFITFVIFGFYRFSKVISTELLISSQKLELNLQVSFSQQLTLFQYFIKNKTNTILLLNDFKSFKNHILNLSKLVGNSLILHNRQKLARIYPNKLILVKRVEYQSTKLISLVISEKLFTILLLKNFYIKNFNINYFNCLQKISIQESISLISSLNKI